MTTATRYVICSLTNAADFERNGSLEAYVSGTEKPGHTDRA